MYLLVNVTKKILWSKRLSIVIEKEERDMFTMNKLNSQQQNGKKVRRVSASLTACVFALTLGSVAVLTAQTVEAAG